MNKHRCGDVDIDFGNRDSILKLIRHTPAAMRKLNPIRKHATGIYVTEIPYDAINNMANIDYSEAEDRGYFKLDFLNVHVYSQVKNEEHLVELMREPDWSRLKDQEFVNQVIHINNHFSSLRKMPEPINSINKLAMFLALIRPGKKHLIGKPWKEVEKDIWDRKVTGYTFRRSHALAYAQLVVVHMNLITENELFTST
jgi:hypothetical protein